MRFFALGFALLSLAAAVPVEYLPPVQEVAAPTAEYLPPVVAEVAAVEEPTVLADDGYRYKTVKKLRLRHRRDVSEISNEYLPPVEQAVVEVAAPVAEVAPVVESAVLADDGYRYKTVKKLRYRHRRDVNEISNEYLPPVEEAVVEVAAPVAEVAPVVESAVLADDGYRYKTVKKLRYRHRRDVNEISNEYLPPVEEAVVEVAAPVAEVAPVVESAVLADDGYRYKTVKKLRYRHRRDVNEISNEYLPPVEEAVVEVAAPVAEVAPVVESAVLADDGYRYKTVKKLRYRHRRDVNEISNEYLPPVEDAVVEIAAPVAEVAPVVESAVLADDGYRYKTVKKLRYRHRRDVNEISNEYLPPVEEAVVEVAAPVAEVAPVVESAVLADDGYRYKTVKKLRYRHRRDVNEISNEYLPPVEEAVVEVAAPVAEVAPVVESAVLADDGYRYKTVKKLRYRHRRDVNEISNEYLPPVEEAVVEVAAPVAEVAPVVESAVLADDGYRYKTVKKLRYRHRRDVNEISNEYLPPVEEAVVEVAAPVAEVAQVVESAVLADDGYRYKTVKKLRYRHRRDVNEISNEYLPPVEEAVVEVAAPVAEVAPVVESAVLADDGYRYKTVKKLRYRHRRDVNEISNEYLPPVEEAVVEIAAPVVEVAPVESAALSVDGYKYKTVKKLKYRLRH